MPGQAEQQKGVGITVKYCIEPAAEVTALILLNARGIDMGTAAFAIPIIRLTTLWFSVAVGSFLLTCVLFNKSSGNDKTST